LGVRGDKAKAHFAKKDGKARNTITEARALGLGEARQMLAS
jgi:hypothetical protein